MCCMININHFYTNDFANMYKIFYISNEFIRYFRDMN